MDAHGLKDQTTRGERRRWPGARVCLYVYCAATSTRKQRGSRQDAGVAHRARLEEKREKREWCEGDALDKYLMVKAEMWWVSGWTKGRLSEGEQHRPMNLK